MPEMCPGHPGEIPPSPGIVHFIPVALGARSQCTGTEEHTGPSFHQVNAHAALKAADLTRANPSGANSKTSVGTARVLVHSSRAVASPLWHGKVQRAVVALLWLGPGLCMA